MLDFYRYYRMPARVAFLATMVLAVVAGFGDWGVAAVYGGTFAVLLLFYALAYRVDVARDRDG